MTVVIDRWEIIVIFLTVVFTLFVFCRERKDRRKGLNRYVSAAYRLYTKKTRKTRKGSFKIPSLLDYDWDKQIETETQIETQTEWTLFQKVVIFDVVEIAALILNHLFNCTFIVK